MNNERRPGLFDYEELLRLQRNALRPGHDPDGTKHGLAAFALRSFTQEHQVAADARWAAIRQVINEVMAGEAPSRAQQYNKEHL